MCLERVGGGWVGISCRWKGIYFLFIRFEYTVTHLEWLAISSNKYLLLYGFTYTILKYSKM